MRAPRARAVWAASGCAIGPFGLGLVGEVETVIAFAEFGVVLLLFVIGLELEPARLWRMKGDIFGLGTSQVLLCGVALVAAALLGGLSLEVALIAGFGHRAHATAARRPPTPIMRA